jgi:hypothetical protein
MNIVLENHRSEAVERCGILLYPVEVALQIVCELEKVNNGVLGIDGFRVFGERIQPDLAHSADFSREAGGWKLAREFLEARRGLGLVFEISPDY